METDRYDLPKTDALRFMEKWLNISEAQASPLEQRIVAYKVDVMRKTDEGVMFDGVF